MTPLAVPALLRGAGWSLDYGDFPLLARDDGYAGFPLGDTLEMTLPSVAYPGGAMGGYAFRLLGHALRNPAAPLAIARCDLIVQAGDAALSARLVVARHRATTAGPPEAEVAPDGTPARYVLVGHLWEQHSLPLTRRYRWLLTHAYPLFALTIAAEIP